MLKINKPMETRSRSVASKEGKKNSGGSFLGSNEIILEQIMVMVA